MKNILTLKLGFAALLCGVMASCSSVAVGDLNVIPQPREVVQHLEEQPFVLTPATPIVCDAENEKLVRTAHFLSSYIKEVTGLDLQVTAYAESGAIRLSVDSTFTNKEGYCLRINADGVELCGGGESGVFYGVQTLFKSLPATIGTDLQPALPVSEVNDAPRFAYRGFMLDVCRHFFPVDYIKQVIDMLALHNINYFHWHLTEDQGWRIEIKKYPRLTEIGSVRPCSMISWAPEYDDVECRGFYTREQAREIVDYAAERFITVIPEIDLPGHMMAALASYPELGCTGGPYEIPCGWGVFKEVLCGGNDRALQFAKDVLEEVMDIFPSEYIHIGGDECPKDRWKECSKCQAKIRQLGLKATPQHSREEQLQRYFMSEVGKTIKARGRKMLGWDEMLHGGLADNATVVAWTHPDAVVKTARLHHNCIVAPIQYFYFSNPNFNKIKGLKSLQRVYDFEPVSEQLTGEERPYIIGAQGCLWTEWTADSLKVEWQILPRMSSLAEVQWSAPEHRNFDGYVKRLPSLLKIYERRGYDYRRDIYDVMILPEADTTERVLRVALSTFGDADIRYTLNGTTPSIRSSRYKKPVEIAGNAELRAVAIRDGQLSDITVERFTRHLATMKPLTLTHAPHKSYRARLRQTLTDGCFGSTNYRDGRWVGCCGEDLQATIDLDESTQFSKVWVNTLINTNDDIFPLAGLVVEISDDGQHFKEVARKSLPAPTAVTMEVRREELSFVAVSSRYVRITAEVMTDLPDLKTVRPEKAFVFADEIGVE